MLDVNKTYLIDLDGTMYHGDRVIADALAFIAYLQKHQISYLFVTNNAMRTPKQMVQKMSAMGFRHLRECDFFTSAMAAVAHMKKVSDAKYVFMIGEQGLREALVHGGYIIDEKRAELVFVGLDRHADFSLYCKAAQCIRMHQAQLVGTNGDRRVPQADGFLIGNGAILRMLEYAGESVSVMCGKPSAYMMEETLAYLGKAKADCVVIGDNLETDIAFGKQNGVKSILVCGGVHGRDDIDRFSWKPDLVVDSLTDLLIK